MHCIIMLLAHIWLVYTLDHMEPELGEPTEQVQAEDLANLALDQGKPMCINQWSLSFNL
jgi:hypothetical protein